jgi:hypothetical protein
LGLGLASQTEGAAVELSANATGPVKARIWHLTIFPEVKTNSSAGNDGAVARQSKEICHLLHVVTSNFCA